jgi:hypothetical protein
LLCVQDDDEVHAQATSHVFHARQAGECGIRITLICQLNQLLS